MNDQLTFLTDARTRRTDPPTSRNAAPSSTQAGELQQRILEAFRRYWTLTDDELCELLPDAYPPTVKTARSRMKNAGLLIPTGGTRKSARGRDMVVWTLPVQS